ncbi:RodZ domain-containing protein [Pseudoalteromonas fenneropenaei]|uniref:RodZ domain-containing protein n=1 Tax=Pseudoalteromonas fenneropenaei TaxID=1737459 RepID=A0ABV7CNY1_9GAMM
MSEETTSTQPETTLGRTLAAARKHKQLSVEYIATKLKLTPVQIERIEADDYLGLGPETFVRGYIKGFCQAVSLDKDAVLALYVGPKVPEKARRMKSFSRRTEKEAHDSRLMLISYIILALVLGSSALWWWQTSKVDKAIEVVPERTAALSDGLQPMANTELSSDLTAKTQDESVSNANDALPTAVGLDEPLSNEVTNQDIPTEPSRNAEQANSAPNTVMPMQSPALTARLQAANGNEQHTIVMTFRDESWVEIFDASSQRIAFGVKKAGYTMTVAGQAPFSVVLGKHHLVDVSFDGNPVDLSSLPKNRLAKFQLPLTE